MTLLIRYLKVATTLSLFSIATALPTFAAEGGAHWGYTGETGPQSWGHVSPVCASGKRQSPINIQGAIPADLYTLGFNYQSIYLQVLNNGHTIQANYQTDQNGESVYNSTMMLGDVPYQLLQFHFHAPSEHAFNGKRYPMEVHLVHRSADGNLAVVGIFLKEGQENPTLAKLLTNASGQLNHVSILKNIMINASDLLPKSSERFHYSGSLTTPPCSENVNWFVMREPIEMSSSQLKHFNRLVGTNARPLQALHWRSVFVAE